LGGRIKRRESRESINRDKKIVMVKLIIQKKKKKTLVTATVWTAPPPEKWGDSIFNTSLCLLRLAPVILHLPHF
jgi:hypothetical protein